MTYRKDIQILRGVAVLVVVLFHLDVPGFASGFLGVDVFFVVSGFLMAQLYTPGNVREFLLKRARRLLPAYVATILATLAAAALIVTPMDFKELVNQAAASALFVPNMHFWLGDSYFDKAEFKPLLHLWSLGVEIQFYLLVPLLAWLFVRARLLLPVLIVGSAVACFLVLSSQPKSAFFLLVFRLWEFLIGFAVARWASQAEGRAGLVSMPWLGAAALCLVVALTVVGIPGGGGGFVSGHPGLLALAIVLATAGVLACGLPKAVEGLRLATALERLGDLSYSIYLVHFPLIVLMLYEPFGGTITKPGGIAQTLLLGALIGVASMAMYLLVERPFRRATRIVRGLLAAGVGIAVLSGLGMGVQAAIFPQADRTILEAWQDRDSFRCGKIMRVLKPRAVTCQLNKIEGTPSRHVLLVGNSHANSLKTAFAEAASRRRIAVHFLVRNSVLAPGGLPVSGVVAQARATQSSVIVVHFSPGALSPAVLGDLTRAASEHGISVAVILPVPVWPEHVPKALWYNAKSARPLPGQTLADYRRVNATFLDAVEAERGRGTLSVHPVADMLCRPNCALRDAAGRPLYFDEHHLTLTGSRRLMPVFDRLLDGLTAAPAAQR